MDKLLMKTGVLLVSLLFVSASFALTEQEMLKSVYKIRTYIENPITGDYVLYSTGSATRITNNRIVTNAHVILDENDEPTGKYEICRMMYTNQDPVCFSVGKLVMYDTVVDLAVLEVADRGPEMALPQLKTTPLQTGDTMIVYGYPAIGGNSITRTEGKVAGRDYDDYKFDGTLHEGSSGGGAFDRNGNLVGVPYAISSENGTIGYIITASTVRKFFDGRTDNYEKIFRPTYDPRFHAYIKRIQKLYRTSSIATPYITFRGIQSAGLTLRNAVESFDENIFDYRFTTKNNRVSMVVMCNKNAFRTNKSDEQLTQEAFEKLANTNANVSLLHTEETENNILLHFQVTQPNGKNSTVVNIVSREGSACNAIVSSEDEMRDRKALNGVIEQAKNIRFHHVSPSTESFYSKFFQTDFIPLDLSITEGTTYDNDSITVHITPMIGGDLDTEGSLELHKVNSVVDYFNYEYDRSDYYQGDDFSFQNFLDRYRYYSSNSSEQSRYTALEYTSRNGKRFIIDTFIDTDYEGENAVVSTVKFFYPFIFNNQYYYYEIIFEYPGVYPEFVSKIAELFSNADLPGDSPFVY